MRNFKVVVGLTLFLSVYYACKKPTIVSSNVSNADAAAMIASSLSSSTYGVNNISTDITVIAQAPIINTNGCAVTKIDTFTRQNQLGSSAIYNYKLIYTHKLACNSSNLPDNITGSLSYSGSFNNANLTLKNSGTTTYTIAGLTPTATVYAINAEYKSSGTFKLKGDTTNTGSVNADIVVKNVVFNKASQLITSGTATAIITGTTVKKGDFTYNGNLTFNGNSLATLSLNGSNYSINIATGVVTVK